MTTLTCTIKTATRGECGEPAVTAFATGEGEIFAECPGHFVPISGRTFAYVRTTPTGGLGARATVRRVKPHRPGEAFPCTHEKIGTFYGRTEFFALKAAERFALREVGEIRPDPLAPRGEH